VKLADVDAGNADVAVGELAAANQNAPRKLSPFDKIIVTENRTYDTLLHQPNIRHGGKVI
jgi:hypothetical protein